MNKYGDDYLYKWGHDNESVLCPQSCPLQAKWHSLACTMPGLAMKKPVMAWEDRTQNQHPGIESPGLKDGRNHKISSRERVGKCLAWICLSDSDSASYGENYEAHFHVLLVIRSYPELGY